ncbi:MAG: tetratricopeptide repeat protein [Gemmatimonadales bacterium]|nr:tetratricopeptide repeat protein [Gemmatimonadota bacterium]MCL4214183.1 tetratricopeptide repeat protein [Gemmatimonadales bacterium]
MSLAVSLPAAGLPAPSPRPGAGRSPAQCLADARSQERVGCIPEAVTLYEAAITGAESAGALPVLSEALRRLAVVRHKRDECAVARELCRRSHAVAAEAGHALLAAEALNTLGVMLLREGSLEEASTEFERARTLGGASRELRARIEQNLGIIANIHGNLDEALQRYLQSLNDYRAANDEHGCALAFHNLGMVSADKGLLDDAEWYFTQSQGIAERAGDVHLHGLCLLNHADVLAARQRFEEARRSAESALVVFDQLGAPGHKSAAYRVIGVVYRETGRLALAESRLRSAIELAVAAGTVLHEAEATRDLAVVYQAMGRNQEALTLLNAAHGLFGRLNARIDLVNVDGKVRDLEDTYLAVVREWGGSIESSDSYTFGHCSRVADNAVAVARALGLDDLAVTTIRLGAYLHDLGKVKVPHEILNKPGPLTRDEFEVVQMHPVWGIELLAEVEFPWDLKPIIRWHHEKYDGTGYPDQLVGDAIPVAAQVVGIVDVYDALTTTRSYRAAMSHPMAMQTIANMRSSWSSEVYSAFACALAVAPVAPVAPDAPAVQPPARRLSQPDAARVGSPE